MPSIGAYLQSAVTTGIQLKDYAHAARLYGDNTYALAPKAGWMYYVVFDIEPNAITDASWANRQRVSEVGMLVKNVELPKFNIQTETLSQYNRKVIVNKSITYNPVSFTLHDDNSNVVNDMWINYYRYYFADTNWGTGLSNATGSADVPPAFQNNKYLPATDVYNPTNYGLNSDAVVSPFFRSITIYQLSRQVFTSYKMINPVIQTWEHDKLDQTNGARCAEHRMTIGYESVFYGTGKVQKDNPTGFAMFHYDTSPSPLSIEGGGNSSIMGPGGVVAGAVDIFGDVTGILTGQSSNVLGTILKGASLAKNLQGITSKSLKAEATAIINTALQNISQGSLNGLGVSLDLGASHNYVTAGTYLGTPVSVVSAKAVGQENVLGTTTLSASSVTSLPPTENSDAYTLLNLVTGNDDLSKSISALIPSNSKSPVTAGTSTSPGSYFPNSPDLPDTTPYTTTITAQSSADDIQLALNSLNKRAAADKYWFSQNTVSSTDIENVVNSATSDAEFNAIKSEAVNLLSSYDKTLTQIDDKYSAERARLTALLAQKTSTSGPSTLA